MLRPSLSAARWRLRARRHPARPAQLGYALLVLGVLWLLIELVA